MQGTYTALITPFKGEQIDYDGLEKIIESQVAAGVDGLVPVGTTGESPTLDHAEHKAVVEQSVKFAAGRVKVYAGAGSNSTRETLEYSQHAEKAGADGVLLVSPYYNKPSQEGLYQHYKTLADSLSIDIILYDIPGRSAIELSMETISRLAEVKNIIALKDATANIDKSSAIARDLNDKLSLISGNDSLTLPILAVGGDGVISVISNIFPESMCALVQAALNGEYKKALDLHQKLWPLFRDLFIESSPTPVKRIALELGLIENAWVRPPLVALSQGNEKALLDSLLEVQSQ